jgi:uncharacterized damage-inducible protein DinB
VSVSVRIEQLLDYSDHERRKWRDWVLADPTRLELPVQRGGRFPTLWDLLEHIYFVERRHLARLEGGTPPDETGIRHGDWKHLFDYADLVRNDLRRYVADADDTLGSEPLTFNALGIGPLTLSRRRLLTHIVLHEVRHLAQVAMAARLAGLEPPGDHDLLFYPEFV